jgi:hypothetical protein
MESSLPSWTATRLDFSSSSPTILLLMLIFYPSPWSMQNEQILAWKLKVSRKVQESQYLSSKSPGRAKNPNVLAQNLQEDSRISSCC